MTPEIEELMARHVPSRLDGEPPLFRGLTLSEMQGVLMIGSVVWLPLSIVISVFIIGVWPIFLGLFAAGLFGTLFVTATALQRMKRNKPEGYHEQKMKLRLHQYGFVKDLPIAYRPGPWETMRTLKPVKAG